MAKKQTNQTNPAPIDQQQQIDELKTQIADLKKQLCQLEFWRFQTADYLHRAHRFKASEM